MKNNFCLDCGKLIWRESTRCHSCANKYKKYWLGKKKPNFSEQNNPSWKGDKVGYSGVHRWVRMHKPKPKFCERCKIKPPFDLANISGKYKRDVNDFEWLCRKCHQVSDGRINNLHRNRKRKTKGSLLQCTKCKKFKSKKEFYKDKWRQDGYDKHCKKCVSKDYKKWREKNKERVNKEKRDYYQKNKDKYKIYYQKQRKMKRAFNRKLNKDGIL